MSVSKKTIWDTQYAEVASWNPDRVRALLHDMATNPPPPEPPPPRFYCSGAQWDEAVAWRDAAPDEKVKMSPPLVALLLGWDT